MINKGFKTLFLISIGLAIADIWLSSQVPHIQYLELNRLYSYGGFTLIAIINIVILGVIYYIYCVRTTKLNMMTTRYMLINILVSLAAGRALAIYTAIKLTLHPITLQQAQNITQEMRVTSNIAYTLIIYIPFILALITFLFYKIDHNIEIKKNKKKDLKNELPPSEQRHQTNQSSANDHNNNHP